MRAMVEKTVRMSLLFDFYGDLLTERQQEFFALYYDHDLSLGEIAQQYGVSRQAVYDILRRSSGALEGFEEKLELADRHRRQTEFIQGLVNELDSVEQQLRATQGVDTALVERVSNVRKSLLSLPQDAL